MRSIFNMDAKDPLNSNKTDLEKYTFPVSADNSFIHQGRQMITFHQPFAKVPF